MADHELLGFGWNRREAFAARDHKTRRGPDIGYLRTGPYDFISISHHFLG